MVSLFAPTNYRAVHVAAHPKTTIGTDEIGRDIYTRLLYGGRLSLLAGVTPVAFALPHSR